MVARDDDDLDRRRRLMLPAKNNLAADTDGLAFSLMNDTIVWDPNPIPLTAGEYFHNQAQTADGRKSPARDEAKKWLLDTLRDGPRWADEILDMAKQEGFSEKTLRRSKEQAGIISERVGYGHEGKSYWRLPEHQDRKPDYQAEYPPHAVCGHL
jgi:putative DNA primase/helicase